MMIQIVERKVPAGDREIFDLDEFLSRPLYAHLAHDSEDGPRESPVWFHWDGQALWIIGGTSFPQNLRREPRCAIGIVDWDRASGAASTLGSAVERTSSRSTPRSRGRSSRSISARTRRDGTRGSARISMGRPACRWCGSRLRRLLYATSRTNRRAEALGQQACELGGCRALARGRRPAWRRYL